MHLKRAFDFFVTRISICQHADWTARTAWGILVQIAS